MSIRKLLAESRKSGPATHYELDADGVILSKTERPARSPFKPGRLSDEERLCILLQTGIWPDDLPAEAWCGVQKTDLGVSSTVSPMPGETKALYESGIMRGYADSESQAGGRDPLK